MVALRSFWERPLAGLQEWDDEWTFTVIYQPGAPPTPPVPPAPPEEKKIPVWVWIAAVLGGAYMLLSRRGEE